MALFSSWFRRWLPLADLQQALEGVTQEYQALATERDQLRETVVSLQNEKLRLEDRLVAAQQDRERLWESFEQALQGERTAYQLHINISMQRAGAGVPYPDAPHIPQHQAQPSNEPLGRRGRQLMSEVLQQETASVLNKQFAAARAGG